MENLQLSLFSSVTAQTHRAYQSAALLQQFMSFFVTPYIRLARMRHAATAHIVIIRRSVVSYG